MPQDPLGLKSLDDAPGAECCQNAAVRG